MRPEYEKMQSIYIATEREDKNHISEVFAALLEHCAKIKKCESVLVHIFEIEHDVVSGSVNIVQSSMVNLESASGGLTNK
jgi:hypothetical protein